MYNGIHDKICSLRNLTMIKTNRKLAQSNPMCTEDGCNTIYAYFMGGMGDCLEPSEKPDPGFYFVDCQLFHHAYTSIRYL